MKYEDLSFKMVNDDGIEVICDITAVAPNAENTNEPYVTFTDYDLDDNDEFVVKYGKLVEKDGEYSLEIIDDDKTISKIKEILKDDIVSYVNSQVQENISV